MKCLNSGMSKYVFSYIECKKRHKELYLPGYCASKMSSSEKSQGAKMTEAQKLAQFKSFLFIFWFVLRIQTKLLASLGSTRDNPYNFTNP